jgi:hypothetical protein
MFSAYATAMDVAERWRPLSSQEMDLADTLAMDASFRVRRRFPTLDARIAAGSIDIREVAAVVAGMVKRAMIAGGQDATTQQAETLGSLSLSRTYANPMGHLYLTDDDVATLADRRPRRAFSVDLASGPT